MKDINDQLKCFFFHFLEEVIFNSFLVYSKSNDKKTFVEYKLVVVQHMLSSPDTNVTAGQMFEQLRGFHFPSEIPAQKKTETPKTLCSQLYEIYLQRKLTSMWKL